MRGFTLLELLAVATAVALLVALAAPPIVRSERRLAAYAAAHALHRDVAGARQRAILAATTVRVVLDTISSRYRVVDEKGDVLGSAHLPAGVVMRTTAHRSSILFSPRGTSNLYSTTWIFVAADPDARLFRLRVTPTGSIESR